MTAPSNANTSGLRDAGLSETYRFAYESIRNGAPGLSDATCAAIARSINMKVSLSKTDCATETDALRLVPKYYATEPKEGGGGGYWEASIELTGGDYIAAEIYGNDREEVEERLKAALSGLLAAPASPLPGGGWQDISTAPKDEGVKVMAFDGTKVGEAVLYSEWEESNDFEDAVLRWRWANDSCSCCWGRAEPQPTHWQPLPAAPTGDAI